jgi:hypothetical protein
LDLVEWSIGPVRVVSVPGEAFHALGRAIEDRVAAEGARAPSSPDSPRSGTATCRHRSETATRSRPATAAKPWRRSCTR